jgi:hypothetical protein
LTLAAGQGNPRTAFMGKFTQAVAVILLSLSLGLHWTALQSVAWTSMLLQRIQAAPFMEALRTTFDGEHPCQLCLVVREGKAAEHRDPTAPVPLSKLVLKLDLFLSSSSPLPGIEPGTALPVEVRRFAFPSRSDPPVPPPPRA